MSQSSSPQRVSGAEVAAILVALGIPAGVVGAFHEFVFAHPVPSLIIGILYVVMAGSVFVLWQRLVTLWIERSVPWIDTRVQWFTSHAHREYCQHLFYQHRDFDVKGLSTQGIYTLQLDQVFVELSIVPKPLHQTSANPIQVPQALIEGRHAIWDYLASPALANQHLVILGYPGSGKTTLLKHISLSLVARNKLPLQNHTIPRKLPIFLALREHSEAITNQTEYTVVSAVQNDFQKWNVPLSSGWIGQHLANGQCLVLLDGLDEVADPETRQQVVNWAQRQMVTYGKNRFIVTSRPFGYASNPLSGVAILEVHPFTRGQIVRFVQNWYLANETMSSQRSDPGVQMVARRGAEDLLQRLRNTPALLELAVNPLLLTMIATVHRYRSSLPGKRVELYAEICEVFMGKRQQARGLVLELTAAQQQRVLQPLAYYLMDKGIREIPFAEVQEMIVEPLRRVHPQMTTEAFLRLVERGSGLLLERENGIYSFAHLTFQEYLAAVHIRENKWEDILVEHVEESWWHETIRLYCAQADASAVIAACLTGNPSIPALTLAFECQAEALEVQSSVRTQLDTLLNQDVERSDPERQRVVAEALLARRLRQMVHLKDETYIDTSLITCAEYQMFLDEQQARGMYYQPYHWENLHFADGHGRTPVLGIRRSDAVAFCQWLTERDPGLWIYRLPNLGEVEEGVTVGIASILKRGTGYWTGVHTGSWPLLRSKLILPVPLDSNQQRFALTFDLDLDLDLDHDLDRAIARAIAIAHARNRAHNLASDLEGASAITSGLSIASDLAEALDHDLDLAQDLANDLDLTHDLAIVRDLALDLALDLAIASAFDLASGLAGDLPFDSARDLERDLASDLVLALALAGIRDLERTFERDLPHDLARTATLIRANARDVASDLDLASDLDFAIARDRTISSARAILDHRMNLTPFHKRNPGGRKQVETLCQCICLLTKELAISQFLSTEEITPAHSQRGSWSLRNLLHLWFGRKQALSPVDPYGINMLLNLYVTFALLEQRIQGTFPACEGILIVKERRNETLS